MRKKTKPGSRQLVHFWHNAWSRQDEGEVYMNNKSIIIAFLGLAVAAVAVPSGAGAREPGPQPKCQPINHERVAALFDTWNKALGDPSANAVVELYANDATLLPTVKNGPYGTKAALKQYFITFLALKPVATIDQKSRSITVGCNVAYDIGLYSFEVNAAQAANRETIQARYTFIYKWDGRHWRIAHHHSSKQPE
jgi:uncharacterized protein (TIGR02246 family)